MISAGTEDERFATELKHSFLGKYLFLAYRYRPLRRFCRYFVSKLEGGQYYSATLRRIFRHYHGVEIGAYSYGDCFVPGVFAPGSKVGRYVSIASALRVFARNHPTSWLSMHPFFFNHDLGVVPTDLVPIGTVWVGDDAWIGDRVIITPGCSRIGIGAVIGAGSVVTKDVPDFAIVAGNPARLIRFRFAEEIQRSILTSRWWEHSLSELLPHVAEMTKHLDDATNHPLLRAAPAKADSIRGEDAPVTTASTT